MAAECHTTTPSLAKPFDLKFILDVLDEFSRIPAERKPEALAFLKGCATAERIAVKGRTR